jgi:ubiquinone biosynthesis protein COQ9
MTSPDPAASGPDAAPDWAEQAEDRVLDAALRIAPDTGWNSRLVARAAREAGLSPGEAELLLPNGPRDLAALAARRHLQRTFRRLDGFDPQSLKIRDRIRLAVGAKVEATIEDGPALRSQAGFYLTPRNAPLAIRLFWESADALWRWAGDTATDENHYSKRAILSVILATTIAVRMNSGEEAAREHLAARIDSVMAFEKWKAQLKPVAFARDLVAALGRLRYR